MKNLEGFAVQELNVNEAGKIHFIEWYMMEKAENLKEALNQK